MLTTQMFGRVRSCVVSEVSRPIFYLNRCTNLPEHNSEIADGVADGLLQLAQVPARVLDPCQRHEQPEDVVGPLEDPEDSQVSHNLFQAERAHEPVPAKNLHKY